MEVFLEVWAEDIPAGQRVSTNRAFYTFVAVDQNGRPIEVPALEPETDEENELYLSALRRRQLRLVLAGRMNAAEATELKALFQVK
jgi:acyl-CoA hydrolase